VCANLDGGLVDVVVRKVVVGGDGFLIIRDLKERVARYEMANVLCFFGVMGLVVGINEESY
jgi:hypothetical protein